MHRSTTETGPILAGLNPEQRQAVETTEGPLLVVAGAGSGKTSVLTRRIAYLVTIRKVAPWGILAITFTNKAAREMQDRIATLVGPLAQDMWTMTFHAMCVRILRRDINRLQYQPGFTILDGTEQLTTVKRILSDLNVDLKRYEPKAVLAAISKAKNALQTATQVRDGAAGNPFARIVGEVYTQYEQRLRTNNSLDFDDLLIKTVELLEHHPDVLQFYQSRFQYIHVDEYQDTNHVQYRLVFLLAQQRRNLCVVGDSDQSIYGWRGADIQNILRFEKDYPEAKVIALEQNYRSTKTILQIANGVIANNLVRKVKTLWTDNPQGEQAVLYQAYNERSEARYIVERIQDYQQKKRSYGQMAILYRTNAQSRVIEEALLQEGIPYRVFGGLKFYDRKEIRDVLGYLRLILNPHDDLSLRRVIHVPKRGVGESSLEKLQVYATTRGWSLYQSMQVVEVVGLKGGALRGVRSFIQVLDELRKMVPFLSLTELTEQVLLRTGYRAALAAEKTLEAEARVENLDEFLSVTREFDERLE
ncbi:ATP-dependent DNA helicase PcrA, partial [Alicyclobacillaceae bacterium I2511]